MILLPIIEYWYAMVWHWYGTGMALVWYHSESDVLVAVIVRDVCTALSVPITCLST
jgi:hypothetical protein